MLRDGDERRLVVRRGVDGRDLVEASGETGRHGGAELAVDRGVVEALEERELGRVRRRRLVESGELLDDNVRVANDLALRVDLERDGIRNDITTVRRRELTCWGAAKKFSSALTKLPVSRLLMFIWMMNAVFDLTLPPFVGNTNLDEGMTVWAAIWPMGAGLQEPVVICWPLVMVWPAQKLMKLFVDVREATWPASGTSWPLLAKPVAMTEGSSARWDDKQRMTMK